MSFQVVSRNFSWHAPKSAPTYAEALATAKAGGWESYIETASGALVATWSPLYGTKVYDRALAGLEPGLVALSCSPVGSCGACKACREAPRTDAERNALARELGYADATALQEASDVAVRRVGRAT